VWLQIIEKNGAGWDLTVERQVSSEGGAAVNLKIEHLPMEALDPDFANSEGRDAFHEAAVSFQARAVSGDDGSFGASAASFRPGSGPLSVSGIDRIEVAGTAFSFALPPTGDRIAIPGGEIRTRAGNVRFDAALDLGEPDSATLTVRVQGGLLPTIGTDPACRVDRRGASGTGGSQEPGCAGRAAQALCSGRECFRSRHRAVCRSGGRR
jgi:hypothetical protein